MNLNRVQYLTEVIDNKGHIVYITDIDDIDGEIQVPKFEWRQGFLYKIFPVQYDQTQPVIKQQVSDGVPIDVEDIEKLHGYSLIAVIIDEATNRMEEVALKDVEIMFNFTVNIDGKEYTQNDLRTIINKLEEYENN